MSNENLTLRAELLAAALGAILNQIRFKESIQSDGEKLAMVETLAEAALSIDKIAGIVANERESSPYAKMREKCNGTNYGPKK